MLPAAVKLYVRTHAEKNAMVTDVRTKRTLAADGQSEQQQTVTGRATKTDRKRQYKKCQKMIS